MWTAEILVIVAMIAMNGVFAGYEIALASVSAARLGILREEGRSGARAALSMKENIARSLAVVQVGITLFGAIAAAAGGAGAQENLAPMLVRSFGLSADTAELIAIVCVVIPLTGFSIVFGELIPKVYALQNQEWLCLRLSPVMLGFASVARPIVALLEGAVNIFVECARLRKPGAADADALAGEPPELRELLDMARLARSSALIGKREEAIIRGAAGLARRQLGEIALPANHIITLCVRDSPADCLITAHQYLHTRYPLTETAGDPQTIIGYVNFKDIVALLRISPEEPTLRAVLHPIVTIAAATSISNALETMMRGNTHIALVHAADNSVCGLVTLEDILEELVGDIFDEHDWLPAHVVPAGGNWVAGGGVTLARLEEVSGIHLADAAGGQTGTLSDWLSAHSERPVHGGDVIVADGVRLAVRKTRREHTVEVTISRANR